jgi:hypothetical protein
VTNHQGQFYHHQPMTKPPSSNYHIQSLPLDLNVEMKMKANVKELVLMWYLFGNMHYSFRWNPQNL